MFHLNLNASFAPRMRETTYTKVNRLKFSETYFNQTVQKNFITKYVNQLILHARKVRYRAQPHTNLVFNKMSLN